METNATTARKFLVDFATRIPRCWTSCGRRGIASDSLFWTWTWATSGFVPWRNVSVIVMFPSFVLSDEK